MERTDPFTLVQRAVTNALMVDPDVRSLVEIGNLVRFDLGSNEFPDEERPADPESLLDGDMPKLAIAIGQTDFSAANTSTSLGVKFSLQAIVVTGKVETKTVNLLRWYMFLALERSRRKASTPGSFGLEFVRRVEYSSPSQESRGIVDPESGAITSDGRVLVMDISFTLVFDITKELGNVR